MKANIPMVEGVIEVSRSDYHRPVEYTIRNQHNTYGVGRAMADTFAVSDQVVVIRKSDYERLERFYDQMIGRSRL